MTVALALVWMVLLMGVVAGIFLLMMITVSVVVLIPLQAVFVETMEARLLTGRWTLVVPDALRSVRWGRVAASVGALCAALGGIMHVATSDITGRSGICSYMLLLGEIAVSVLMVRGATRTLGREHTRYQLGAR